MQAQFHLRHEEPAMRWKDALPMGNGFLGAMVYGHTAKERIQLNEDSLWYGKPENRINPKAAGKLKEIQEKVLDRRFDEAEELMYSYMVSSPPNMRNYSTLGELDLALNQQSAFPMGWFPESEGEDYESDLDLENGILRIVHIEDGVRYEREMFVSFPDKVMVIRLKSSRPGAIRLDVMLNRYPFTDAKAPDDRRPGKYVSAGVWPATRCDRLYTLDGNRIIMEGHEAETRFAVGVSVATDGRIEDCYSRLIIREAQEVVLLVTAATDNREKDCPAAVKKGLDHAAAISYEELKRRHILDFSPFMRCCSLAVAEDASASRYFQFARYLMVSGSREGSSAMNLQGIWNSEFDPSWDSKYTVNINLQMNYWPAEICNLSSLHSPLFELLHKMEESGEKCAREMYGCRGMMCHHNTDFYGDCAPQDVYPAATIWQCGGAWLGLHIWEHYRYTLDEKFLRQEYPVLEKLALFFVDFLIEDKEGFLVTCPSVSPENRFVTENGYDTPICAGPAIDSQIIRALMIACLEAGKVLGIHNDKEKEFEKVLNRLRPNQIDSMGRLMEWASQEKELTPDMVHTSHLWAVYPGDEIAWNKDRDLFDAAKKALYSRIEHGARSFGWPGAWHIAFFARFLDGGNAGRIISMMLEHGLSRSLLNAENVFQIDGNMGLLAGMAECLLQSHAAVHFLPALPPSWKNGWVKGLRARGGIETDIYWQDGMLTAAWVKSDSSRMVEFTGNYPFLIRQGDRNIEYEECIEGYRIYMEEGKQYELLFGKTEE